MVNECCGNEIHLQLGICGVLWETKIRSVTTILSSLLNSHGTSLNDESLQMLLIEVQAIANSRLLTTDFVKLLSDVNSTVPLS